MTTSELFGRLVS